MLINFHLSLKQYDILILEVKIKKIEKSASAGSQTQGSWFDLPMLYHWR